MTRFIALLLLVSTALLPLPASAWSNPGHRMVGELAQRHLTPAANMQVAELLKGEAEPSLAGVASWADTLRKSDPESHAKTQRWHYINFPAGTCAYRAQRDCPDGNCVVGQIVRQRALLADRTRPVADRRDALKLLVHFVGDVHQPLHAGNRKDKGGNDFQVSLRTDIKPNAANRKNYVGGVMGSNLHSVWDYYVLASAGLSPERYSAQLAARQWPPKLANRSMEPSTWASESCGLVDAQKLYPKNAQAGQRLPGRAAPAGRTPGRSCGQTALGPAQCHACELIESPTEARSPRNPGSGLPCPPTFPIRRQP